MKLFKTIKTVGVLGFVLFFVTLSYGADIPAVRDAKDATERARVQALVDGAKKENILDVTGVFVEPKHLEHIVAGFKEYYGLPQLKVNHTYGKGMEVISRMEEVLKAGRTPPDIAWVQAWDWFVALMKAGRLMRYDSPYYKEYTLSHKAGLSMSGYWVSDAYSNNPMWNVKELEKRGIKDFNPASWADFADPKIAPLLCFTNMGTSSTAAAWAVGMRKVMGDEWFIKLAKGKPGLYEKAEQGEAWVTSGEYPIGLMMRPKHATDFEAAGGKVGWIWPKEGQILLPYAPVIFANAPHPNTAKLFVDYVRSARGVDRMSEAGVGLIYGRPGVKIMEKDKKFLRPSEDVKVIPIDWSKEMTPETMKTTKAWAKKIGVGY